MSKLPHDVQRDMSIYCALVDLRNAVERMRLRRGTLPDPDHVFWGFGRYSRRPRRSDDDDGLAGSRVPRRPRPDAGGAEAAQEQLDWEAGASPDARQAEARTRA